MRELLVFRHAEATSLSESGRDIDRPLTESGRGDALRQADWLRESRAIPDRVICSPAARTRTTAELACEHLGVDPRRIEVLDYIYEASTGELVRALEFHDGGRLMLVGHNPGLSMLVTFLTGSSASLHMGSIARITFDPPCTQTPQPNCGHLITVRHPSAGIDRG